MSFSNLDQQNLFRRTWSISTKRNFVDKMGPTMKVIGKVLGHVCISDLGKNISLGEVVDFSEYDINRSKDLHHAIKMKWVDVIENRSALLRSIASTQPEQKDEGMNKQEILELAKEMAKTMVQEMIKNDGSLVKEIKNEINNLKTTISDRDYSSDKKDLKIDDSQNIFIDVSEQDSNLTTNIQDIGIVKEEKSDISNSLEKMKRFRRKPI